MWDLFSRKVKFQVFGLFTIFFLLAYILTGNVFPDIELNSDVAVSYVKVSSYFASYLTGVYFFLRVVGMSPWRVVLIRNWLNKNVGPDLRGHWSASFIYRAEDNEQKEKTIFFEINMTLFDFAMSIPGGDGYSSSNVVSSKLVKDELMGSYVLYYVFESEVANPLKTDVVSFQGSAKLRVNSDHVLTGSYWTNRNYQNGLQTAGSIRLARVVTTS